MASSFPLSAALAVPLLSAEPTAATTTSSDPSDRPGTEVPGIDNTRKRYEP
jgi:hypothetical protein